MKKILIISTNAIGDTYLSMSAIKPLLTNLSGTRIYFLVQPNSAFLFENTEVAEIIEIRKKAKDIINKFNSLRKIKFDYIFSFFPGTVNTFFLKLLKANNKGGYPNSVKRKLWHDSDLIGYVKTGNEKKKVTWGKENNYLNLILNILKEFFPSINPLTKYRYAYKIFENENKYGNDVVIHPFSYGKTRSLSNTQVKDLVGYLRSNGNFINIVFLGDEKINKIDVKGVNKIIRPSINELIDLVHCKLFISVDSFPLHIADAYNANFVGLFSNTLPQSVLVNSEKSFKFFHTSLTEVNSNEINKRIKKFWDCL